MERTLALTCDLIRRQSVTPEDAGCQALMMERLQQLGFTCTRLRFGEVENFWAVRGESGQGAAIFALQHGHVTNDLELAIAVQVGHGGLGEDGEGKAARAPENLAIGLDRDDLVFGAKGDDLSLIHI